MQTIIFQCDQCAKNLIEKDHIHIDTRSNCRIGISRKQKNSEVWGLHNRLNSDVYHFCNGQCIQRFFSALMKDKS